LIQTRKVLQSLSSTIRCKKPYIYCPFYDEFWSTNIETLATALAHRRSVGNPAARSEHHVTLLHVTPPPRSLISSSADHWSSSSTSLKVGASRPASCALLRLHLPFEDPLGEFPWMRRVSRTKPHKIGAPAPVNCRRGLVSGCPRLDRRFGLDRRYPFVLIKSEPSIIDGPGSLLN
jgi:hypothetical protein